MNSTMKRSISFLRHGVMPIAAMLAVLLTLANSASAIKINFDPAVAASDIEEFEISPDGTMIVMNAALDNGLGDQTYVATIDPNIANPATRVSPDGSGDNDGGVGWSPDQTFVVTRYDAMPPGNTNEIFLLPADGSQTAQQLTFNSTNAFDPQISGDGNSLFYSNVDALYVTPIAGASASSSTRLTPAGLSEIDTGSYAQIGSDVIFSGFATPVPGADNSTPENAFYRTAGDGSTAATPTLISITNFPASLPFMSGGDSMADIDHMSITPDGQSIVFRGDLTTDAQDELYSVPIGGGDATPLLTGPLRDNFDLNWFTISSDGSTIAFVGDYLTDGVAELFVIPSSGGTPFRVSESAGFSQANGSDVDFGGVDTVDFSPDSKFIYYLADETNGTFELFRVANPIPEPTSLMLLLSAVGILGLRRQ